MLAMVRLDHRYPKAEKRKDAMSKYFENYTRGVGGVDATFKPEHITLILDNAIEFVYEDAFKLSREAEYIEKFISGYSGGGSSELKATMQQKAAEYNRIIGESPSYTEDIPF